ncbi:MAG: hypothetical protein US68_C0006G0002 [Candidatus Shapirobacteria bacterium GW2011_GWE1_38_10]|uniref:Uncharacterized protein n=1 Tax=Candidatus Shapirobacteria bacterium GW2011_GWE1_38_10 TaxID=1618488 RepID=A0A0G0I701_9BACT|nr:MAG: hypothetical protein US46_C0001G0048 [Candidatus Shapirobacteria bacterium GW2011_GWF2_37_20]KKQ50322.1 MAG: hypothetical protein US68_C0006G0002 [Candidatus Shapirobacteria bacterium GW2011_GWE1_38_10]KKQ65145.1 MAG: hypothetical protein US85_C0001G0072 [Candidatus Shapirobacteria bacterium GW2011_GWF1_38_23]HBP50936.1 hypothetical protein [Candidatus Shapirobacteria bacterium]
MGVGIIPKIESVSDKRTDQNSLEKLKPLLRRIFPELNKDLTPGLPADLIREEEIKRRLFPNKKTVRRY